MGRRLVGITVERVRVEIRAPGTVSPAECVTDPADCCEEVTPDPTYGVGGAACCPDADTVDTIEIVAEGPIGFEGATCMFTWNLVRSVDEGTVWDGWSAVGTDDCANAAVLARVWCSKDENGLPHWFGAGQYTDNADLNHFYGPVELEDDGTDLSGEVVIPGQVDPLTFVIVRPCTSAAYNCVSGACVAAEGGTYATLAACQAQCNRFDCVSGACVNAEGGTYATLALCQDAPACSGIIELAPGPSCDQYTLLPSDNATYLLSNQENTNNGYYYIAGLTPGSMYYVSVVWSIPVNTFGHCIELHQASDCCAPPGLVSQFNSGPSAGNVLDCHTFIVGADGKLCFSVAYCGGDGSPMAYFQVQVTLKPGACAYCASAPSYTLGNNQAVTLPEPYGHTAIWYSLGVLAAGPFCLAGDFIGDLNVQWGVVGGTSCGNTVDMFGTPMGDPVTGFEYTANGTDTVWVTFIAPNAGAVGAMYNFTVNSGACP